MYLWADGLYVKAGLEREKAALLVVIGAFRDGHKEVLAVAPGYRESTESWAAVLRDLKARGLSTPKLVVADGHLGDLERAGAGVAGGARATLLESQSPQRPRSTAPQGAGGSEAPADPYPLRGNPAGRGTTTQGVRASLPPVVPEGGRGAGVRLERMLSFYDFPEAHWKHLLTTNVVESPFAAVRLRTTAAKRFKKVANATALIWRVLM